MTIALTLIAALTTLLAGALIRKAIRAEREARRQIAVSRALTAELARKLSLYDDPPDVRDRLARAWDGHADTRRTH